MQAQPSLGYALYFDGVDDYVTVPDNSVMSPPNVTMEAWFHPEDLSGNTIQTIASEGSNLAGYALEIDPSSDALSFRIYIENDGWYSSPAYIIPTENRWYHAAGTFNGSQISLYVNGKLIGSTSKAGSLRTSVWDFEIT